MNPDSKVLKQLLMTNAIMAAIGEPYGMNSSHSSRTSKSITKRKDADPKKKAKRKVKQASQRKNRI